PLRGARLPRLPPDRGLRGARQVERRVRDRPLAAPHRRQARPGLDGALDQEPARVPPAHAHAELHARRGPGDRDRRLRPLRYQAAELGADAAQRGGDRGHAVRLGELLVALGQVAAVAAELLEEVLAARDLVRAVQVLHAGVALDAVGGLLLAAEERLLDELDVLDVSVLVEEVPVRGLDAVDRRPLPAVAGCAAELLGRMLAEEELTAGVRLPRVRLVLEAGLADASVAGHTPIDARDRLAEVVAVERLEHELLDLRNLRLPVEAEERRSGLRPGEVAERYALELLPEVVARRRQLGERILRRLHGALEGLDLVLQVLDVRLRLAVDLLALDAH